MHCLQGVSRSASLVIGYIMYLQGLPHDVAVAQVKTRREVVQPNFGFLCQVCPLAPSLFCRGCLEDKASTKQCLHCASYACVWSLDCKSISRLHLDCNPAGATAQACPQIQAAHCRLCVQLLGLQSALQGKGAQSRLLSVLPHSVRHGALLVLRVSSKDTQTTLLHPGGVFVVQTSAALFLWKVRCQLVASSL